MKNQTNELKEYLEKELEELYETCSSCPHEHDFGKDACNDCGTSSSIWNMESELRELEEEENEL